MSQLRWRIGAALGALAVVGGLAMRKSRAGARTQHESSGTAVADRATEPPAAAATPEQVNGPRWPVDNLMSGFGGPAAVVTAILFYIGWTRAQVQNRVFGVDVRALNLSDRDFVVSALNFLIIPAVALIALIWIALLVDGWLNRRLFIGQIRLALGFSWAFLFVGFVFFLRAWASLTFSSFYGPPHLFPLSILAGVILTAYALRLRRRVEGRRPNPSIWRPDPLISKAAARVLVVALAWFCCSGPPQRTPNGVDISQRRSYSTRYLK
jgi:hypothetical protein